MLSLEELVAHTLVVLTVALVVALHLSAICPVVALGLVHFAVLSSPLKVTLALGALTLAVTRTLQRFT